MVDGKKEGREALRGISGRRGQHRRLSTPAGEGSRVFRLHESCFHAVYPLVSLSLEISGLEAERTTGGGRKEAAEAAKIQRRPADTN